jgi:hypothetical protein
MVLRLLTTCLHSLVLAIAFIGIDAAEPAPLDPEQIAAELVTALPADSILIEMPLMLPSDNAWPLLIEAMNSFQKPKYDTPLGKALATAARLRQPYPSGEEAQLIDDYLSSIKSRLMIFERALDKPILRFPFDRKKNAPKNWFGTINALCETKRIQARRAIVQKNPRECWSNIRYLFRLAGLINQSNARSMDRIIANANISFGCSLLNQLLSCGPENILLSEIITELESINSDSPSLLARKSLQFGLISDLAEQPESSEEFLKNWVKAQMAMGKLRAATGQDSPTAGDDAFARGQSVAGALDHEFLLDRDETVDLALQWIEILTASELTADREAWRKQVKSGMGELLPAAFDAEAVEALLAPGMSALMSGMFKPEKDTEMQDAASNDDAEKQAAAQLQAKVQALFEYENPVGLAFLQMWSSTLPSVIDDHLRADAQHVLVLTKAATALYRSRTGNAPKALTDLVEAGLMKSVPMDPFDCKPVRYDSERQLLWSIGTNGLDDEGDGDPNLGRGKDMVLKVGLEYEAAVPSKQEPQEPDAGTP